MRNYQRFAFDLTPDKKHYLIQEANGKCSECGGKNELTIHHKDSNVRNDKLDNLQVLCKQCHYKKHHGKPKND